MADENLDSSKSPHPSSEGSVKETIESILVAFILAFIFRAFVVEAFVIPTGSMGPTLMGAHLRHTCPDCGYTFQTNFSAPGGDDTDIPAYVPQGPSVVCPNCGFQINPPTPTPVFFGDRILVLKYRYLFQEPDPWDVVVFKSPFEKHRDPDDPKYADNYIKRLVGRPGESVMVLDGDVYIGRPGMTTEQFEIRRKPPHAQEALWRDVYNNDYVPHGITTGGSIRPIEDWKQPWVIETGAGWTGPRKQERWVTPDRIFRFANPQGASTITFDSTANHSFDSLTDWIAYDQQGTGSYVSDLKLSGVYRRTAGQGALGMQLTKRDDCFSAQFLPGKVVLTRSRIEGRDPLQSSAPIWRKEAAVPELALTGIPVEVEFTNVDYRIAVRINGREVLATDNAEYAPDVASLYREALEAHRQREQARAIKPIIRIAAADQTCSLEHLRLARDVYYLNSSPQGHLRPDASYSNEPFWGSPENIVHLGADEYFVLGDNSYVSLDARWWGAPVDLPREGNYHAAAGRVPGRFMLGKAFFVYWPAGYRPPSLPYGVEPDFGDMRFIH